MTITIPMFLIYAACGIGLAALLILLAAGVAFIVLMRNFRMF